MHRVACRGPIRQAPGALKGGPLLKLSTSLSQLKGGPFGEKTNFRKKSLTMPKTERGTPFGIFKHPFCCKILKKLKGGPFGEKKLEKKSHNAEKLKGGTLWGFSTSILSQNIKKLKGQKVYIFGKKSQCRKNQLIVTFSMFVPEKFKQAENGQSRRHI